MYLQLAVEGSHSGGSQLLLLLKLLLDLAFITFLLRMPFSISAMLSPHIPHAAEMQPSLWLVATLADDCVDAMTMPDCSVARP